MENWMEEIGVVEKDEEMQEWMEKVGEAIQEEQKE